MTGLMFLARPIPGGLKSDSHCLLAGVQPGFPTLAICTMTFTPATLKANENKAAPPACCPLPWVKRMFQGTAWQLHI